MVINPEDEMVVNFEEATNDVVENNYDDTKISGESFVDAVTANSKVDNDDSNNVSKEAKWYVLHTYSGYENMVKENLEMVFKKNNMQNRLFEVTIPMEDVVEEKSGKRKIVQRKMFPCYVFIKMIYDNTMWHMIVQTRGVTGFVGPQGRPIVLSEDEVRRMHLEKIVVSTEFKVGDKVTVTDGPLKGFVGEIESLDAMLGKVKVVVSMFGRMTPVDLDLYQITPIEG